jgi:alpha-tubulin suppressor-like RCC1 family protein
VGGNTSCALLEDTSVVCWGTNFDGELGDNGVLDVSFSPVQVVESSGAPLLGISKVVAGAQYACALRTIDGAVFCWGAGAFIGNGTNVGSPAAVQTLRFGDVPLVQIGDIEGGTDVVLARSGASWLSWGRGRALGQGEANASLVATQLMSQPLPSFTSVSVGPNNGCGTTAAGEAYCWGNDIVLAGLGAGETDVPTRFAQLDGTAAFEISSRIGFAVDADGRVRAFGDAGDGLAAGLRDDAALEPLGPTELPGIIAVKQLAQGVNFACALQVDDTVACWGINNRGQIGIGSTTRADAPVLVQPLRR